MTSDTSENGTDEHRKDWGKLLKVLLPVAIVVAGLVGAAVLVKTRPKAEKRPQRATAMLVNVQRVTPTTESVTLHAMGTVVPAREITLKSRVGGPVVRVSDQFVDGGVVHEGDEILRIDPVDYELAVARARSNLAQAEYEWKLELGQQKVASRQWEMLNPGEAASAEERELALRQPHLARVEAAKEAAAAQLRQAELDLERTVVRAPFNAVIRMRHVELGAQVSTQDPLAALVGIDAYWVKVSVPVDRLDWLTIPRANGEPGSHVRVLTGSGAEPGQVRNGEIIRLLSDLEEQGRMARLLVRVEDPMSLQATSDTAPLLLGSYVRVEVQGRSLEQVYRIPRAALRDNARVWVVAPDDTLDIRDASVVWRSPETVLLDGGLEDGDRMVVSDIGAPVRGMQLNINDGADETATHEHHYAAE